MIYIFNDYGAGGGCSTEGVPIYGNSPGGVKTGVFGIGTVSAAVLAFQQVVAVATNALNGGGGGQPQPPGPSACDVFIGVVTQAPVNGVGAGQISRVTFHSDGSWSADGNDVSVIFPRI